MKLVQLEYFCAVCRYHSITRAAEELYVTQPTISVAIRELEKELHLRLFHHEKNRISLTQEGEAFYKRADAVLRETRAMVTEFSSLGKKETPIRIGIPPLVSTIFFPALTDGFQEKTGFPVTYAGGVHSLSDLDRIRILSGGCMDVTVGSALSLFGGSLDLFELAEYCKSI